jgi:hypothetical protein
LPTYSFGAARRPPAPPRPATAVDPALERLRRKVFAVGRENKLNPSMVKNRALVRFGEPVFDRLSTPELEELITIFEQEISERRRGARRTNELTEETAKKAGAAAVASAKKSGLRSLASDTTIHVNEPPFEARGPSRFAVGLQRMDRGQDIRTGQPIAESKSQSKTQIRTAPLSDPRYDTVLMRGILSRMPNVRIVDIVEVNRTAM